MSVCTCVHVYVLQDRDQLQVLFLRMASPNHYPLETRPPLFIWSLSIRLVLRIHLPLPSQHWDYKHMLPGLASYEIDSEGSEVALGSFVITQQAISWLARLASPWLCLLPFCFHSEKRSEATYWSSLQFAVGKDHGAGRSGFPIWC